MAIDYADDPANFPIGGGDLPPAPPPANLQVISEEQRALDILTAISRPDATCSREAASRLFTIRQETLDAVFAANETELTDCVGPLDPCDCAGGGSRLIPLEFNVKGTFKSTDWLEARPGSEGLSEVVARLPYDGKLVRVVATSSRNQTPLTANWNWRMQVDGTTVAAHPVTGISGATSWDVDVDDEALIEVDVAGESEDSVNDAYITLWFEV